MLLGKPPAEAASCSASFEINNPTKNDVFYQVRSKTRANVIWKLRTSNWIKAGDRYVGSLTFPLVGCRVKRQVQIKYRCGELGGDNRGGSERVYKVSGGNYFRPDRIRFRPDCRG